MERDLFAGRIDASSIRLIEIDNAPQTLIIALGLRRLRPVGCPVYCARGNRRQLMIGDVDDAVVDAIVEASV